ncbi:MAG: hypothetical protein RIQ81_1784 [Pseudomonadota bacterium]|jgi:D-serine deaminase-like pyridoxal phosphate-dependent protein
MADRYQVYKDALSATRLPALFIDLEQLKRNIDTLAASARGRPVRIATKSIRCTWVLRQILNQSAAFKGLMAYSVSEAVWLSKTGFEDILTGYPTTEPGDFEEAAELSGATGKYPLTFMACAPEHLDKLQELAKRTGTQVNVCLDVDHSLALPGLHFGVRRSPLRSVDQVMRMVREALKRDGLIVRGFMGYEAQVAGVPDRDPLNWRQNSIIRMLKRGSLARIKDQRRQILEAAVRMRGELNDTARLTLDLFNGGGTGSLSAAADDPSLTELTAGSGFYAPGLFDHYENLHLNPAMGFALRVTRRPDQSWRTCHGGGLVASGAAGKAKLPRPWLPEGLLLSDLEGAGEVQTPLTGNVTQLGIGDPVFFRHAKAGELCEHFNEIHLIEDGKLKGTAPTYRGEGKKFI